MKLFAASPTSVSAIQTLLYIAAIIGLFHFDLNYTSFVAILIGYYLYAGIGLMMLHRYWTHRSFEFKNKIIKWIFTWFGLMLGRGSIIGWVHVHREHHAFSDTKKDPHYPNLRFKSIFFPSIAHCGKNINKKIIKDLFNRTQLKINDYYLLLILGWIVFLAIIDPWILYFGWVVPVLLSHVMINAFVFFGHRNGYTTYDCRDNSKNFWPFGYFLWGEGWHNNHHKNARAWNYKNQWWEVDLMAPLIKLVKIKGE